MVQYSTSILGSAIEIVLNEPRRAEGWIELASNWDKFSQFLNGVSHWNEGTHKSKSLVQFWFVGWSYWMRMIQAMPIICRGLLYVGLVNLMEYDCWSVRLLQRWTWNWESKHSMEQHVRLSRATSSATTIYWLPNGDFIGIRHGIFLVIEVVLSGNSRVCYWKWP